MALLRPFPFVTGYRLQDGDQMNKVAMEPAYSLDTAVVAEGNSQVTSYYLEATTNVITGGADGTGVRLPQPNPCWAVEIFNNTASGKVIYPHFAADETINGSSTLALPAGAYVRLFCAGSNWIGFVYEGPPADRTAVRMQAQWDVGSIVQNGTFYFCFDAPYAGIINSLKHVCNTGSFTLDTQINGVDVTGLSAVTPTSTPTVTPATANNAFAQGGTISGIISSAAGSPTNALLSLNITWTG